MSEESYLISPEEVNKRIRREVPVEPPKRQERPSREPLSNTAGTVKIEFETLGRFNMPNALHFYGYKGKHILDLSMTTEENLVENLLVIIQELLLEKDKFHVEDMLPQEFLEVMVGLKIQFGESPMHDHQWICECQVNDKNKEPQVKQFDLRKLNYIPIIKADEKIRELYKEHFQNMTEDEFLHYLELKYPEEEVINAIDYDRMEELGKMELKEPISQTIGEEIFKFRFTRMKDIIEAQKYVENKYAVEKKKIEMYKPHGMKQTEVETHKEKKMKALEENKIKDLIFTIKALSIIQVNGEEITTTKDKIDQYGKVTGKEMFEFSELMDYTAFGIGEESDFNCSLCGKVDRRSLRREFDPYEFVPMGTDSSDKLRSSARGSILFGV